MMAPENIYHALEVGTDVCFGCTHCMIKCPTGAIRILKEKAVIRKEWCVDCAECMHACPVNAIYVVQDDFQKIFNYKYHIALLPSVFIGQFSKQISKETIFGILYHLGFTHMFQVEQKVSVVLANMTD